MIKILFLVSLLSLAFGMTYFLFKEDLIPETDISYYLQGTIIALVDDISLQIAAINPPSEIGSSDGKIEIKTNTATEFFSKTGEIVSLEYFLTGMKVEISGQVKVPGILAGEAMREL